MKKLFAIVATVLMALNASASNVEKIEFANQGQFTLGAMVGFPKNTSDANMPFITVDGMIGIKDGFIKTSTFGANGAIDAGIQIGYCHWKVAYEQIPGDNGSENKTLWGNIPINLRAGFHWEFVKRLDVYGGLQGGLSIDTWKWKDELTGMKNSGADVHGIFGLYMGAKWYFTRVFGVKAELSGDFIKKKGNNLPIFSAGVTFNF